MLSLNENVNTESTSPGSPIKEPTKAPTRAPTDCTREWDPYCCGSHCCDSWDSTTYSNPCRASIAGYPNAHSNSVCYTGICGPCILCQ